MRALLCAVAALLIAAGPARGATIAVHDDLRAVGVAIAGPDLVIMRELRNGSTQVVAVPRTGGLARTLLTVPSVQSVYEAHGQLAASARWVAVITEIEDRRDRPVEWRVYAGPPSGPLQIVRRLPYSEGWEPLRVDVAGDRVLIVEEVQGGGPLRAFTLDPASGLVPLAWAEGKVTPIALAGPHAAAYDARSRRIVVVDQATGAEQASLPPGDVNRRLGVDVATDGRLVYRADEAVSLTGPGLPPRAVPGSRDLTRADFAGTALTAFDERGTPLLVGTDGARTPLGPPTTVLTASTADDQGLAWIANGCVRYAALPLTAAAPEAGGPCPTTEISLAYIASSKLRGRTVRVPMYCVTAPKGVCRGTILGRDGERGRRFVARGRFAVPAGKSRDVPMRIERATLERFRRKHFGFFIIDARIPNGRIGRGADGASELGVDGLD